MALIIENSTKCPLCGEVLSNEKEFIEFPHFIANMSLENNAFSEDELAKIKEIFPNCQII